jgi:hypothetical protein
MSNCKRFAASASILFIGVQEFEPTVQVFDHIVNGHTCKIREMLVRYVDYDQPIMCITYRKSVVV